MSLLGITCDSKQTGWGNSFIAVRAALKPEDERKSAMLDPLSNGTVLVKLGNWRVTCWCVVVQTTDG